MTRRYLDLESADRPVDTTPCYQISWPYDTLADKNAGPSRAVALAAAIKICGGCDIRHKCEFVVTAPAPKVSGTCARPGCYVTFDIHPRGRNRLYCGEACGAAARRMVKGSAA